MIDESPFRDDRFPYGHVITPARYVGAVEVKDDDEPFEEKLQRLTAELCEPFVESVTLQETIKVNWEVLVYEL